MPWTTTTNRGGSTPRRSLALTTAVVLLGALASPGAALGADPPARAATPAAASRPFGPGPCEGAGCPDRFPLVSGHFAGWRDEAVNVYAGGGITATGLVAEMEGRIVTGGDFTLDKQVAGLSLYNVGVVGLGSMVIPPAGGDHLTVVGDVTVADGNTLAADGGVVRYGGTRTGSGTLRGQERRDPTAGDAYAEADADLRRLSTCVADQRPTGRVAITGWSVTFVGDGVSRVQVFETDRFLQSPTGGSVDFQFRDIPDGATVLVNVTGTDARLTTYSGDLMDHSRWNELRDRMLWNFPHATSIALGGPAQFQGSVLAARPDSTATVALPGFAGRFFTAGSLVHTSNALGGVGGEFHAYPFEGELPDCDDGPPDPPTPPEPPDPPAPPEPPASEITVDKEWIIDGIAYAHGSRPDGYDATLTLDDAAQEWGAARDGRTEGAEVTIAEQSTVGDPTYCALDSARLTEANGEPTDLPVPSTVTLGAGSNHYTVTNSVTCGPRLTLVKRVLSGDRPPSDWELSASPPGASPGDPGSRTVTGDYDGVDVPVRAGVTYTLSESGPDDTYWLAYLRCDVGEHGEWVDATDVTVPTGGHTTCVFSNTNSDEPILRGSKPKITLVKKVDNGSTVLTFGPGDWVLSADGPDHIAGRTGEDVVTESDVAAGTYRLAEAGPDGYDASAWTCTGALGATDHSVTLLEDEHATCTITNTARPPVPERPMPPLLRDPPARPDPPTAPPDPPTPPTPPTSTPTTAPGPPPATSHGTTMPRPAAQARPDGSGTLPRTGAEISSAGFVGLGLVVAGLSIVLVVRRHRASSHEEWTVREE